MIVMNNQTQSQFQMLLDNARAGEAEACGELLQCYANYLTILATTQLDQKLRRRVSPSDLVQETMFAAHRDFGDFRGATQSELLGWLRKILINSLHHAVSKHVKAVKRDVRREVSIEQLTSRLEQSACNLASLLAGREQSPSHDMQSRERAIELSNKLACLNPQYREVIVYRIVQGLSFDEVAERMGRSAPATRMLFLRALDQFKSKYEPPDDD